MRRFAILFMVICFLAQPTAVYADLVWGPSFRMSNNPVLSIFLVVVIITSTVAWIMIYRKK